MSGVVQLWICYGSITVNLFVCWLLKNTFSYAAHTRNYFLQINSSVFDIHFSFS